jgi:hypothetical protein
MLDGTTIANNWTDLTDGLLAHSIDVDEGGATQVSPVEVWTGTDTNGALLAGQTCANWTNATSSFPYAAVGVSDLANGGWTNVYQQFCDHTDPHLYCFEQ